jgi:hypothetical protein
MLGLDAHEMNRSIFLVDGVTLRDLDSLLAELGAALDNDAIPDCGIALNNVAFQYDAFGCRTKNLAGT